MKRDDARGGAEEHFEAALDRLGEGAPDGALVEAAREPDPVLRAYIEVLAHLDLGMAEAARGALGRLTEAAGADDPVTLRAGAEHALRTWDLALARSRTARLADIAPDDPWVFETLALLADMDGDEAAARAAQARARDLDPDAVPEPFSVTDDEFDAIVEETLERLPDMFRRAIAHMRIVREPTPAPELAEGAPLDTPPDALGLFVGPTIHDVDGEAELPATIYLFRRNLERLVGDAGALGREVRITLLHEIGHALGLDEDEVAAMGLA